MKPGVRWFLISVLLLALIVVPFVMFGEQFDRLGASMMRGDLAGWPAAALVSSFLALDIILPVPSSIVSTGAGALFGFARGTAVIWVGMMAGAIHRESRYPITNSTLPARSLSAKALQSCISNTTPQCGSGTPCPSTGL